MTRMASAISEQMTSISRSIARVRLGRVGHGPGRQQRRLPPLHHLVDREGDHRRQQQDQADHGAHLEVLLADHLLVDVGRQHVELAADHLGHAEIGDHQGEDDEDGADQAVARARDGHRPEGPAGAGAQRLGRLVEPGVGDRQRGGDDDQRVREGPEHLADDDADRPVDRGAEQQALGQALVAEQVDEADRRQQRGRQDRDLGDRSGTGRAPACRCGSGHRRRRRPAARRSPC